MVVITKSEDELGIRIRNDFGNFRLLPTWVESDCCTAKVVFKVNERTILWYDYDKLDRSVGNLFQHDRINNRTYIYYPVQEQLITWKQTWM